MPLGSIVWIHTFERYATSARDAHAISILRNQAAAGPTMLKYGWQSDPELWAKVPDDLRDSPSWRCVGFSEKEAVLVPDGKSGIYFLCTSPAGRRPTGARRRGDLFSKLFTPIYIGKTEDLQRRFLEHCRQPSSKLSAARHCFGDSLQFWFHRLELCRLRDCEAICIACFGPTANDRSESIRAVLKTPIAIGIHSN